jgi:GNAT superfamily N-acetyltransferase
MNIRQGEEKDLKRVMELIQELAHYEKAPHDVTLTLEQLRNDGFGTRKLFDFIVADVDGELVGMAFYFFRYSTWKGKFLYLEDFIITESYRNRGIGSRMFQNIMRKALEEHCVGMCWQVLDWNTPALKFYQKFNTSLDPSWINGSLSREEMMKHFK